MVAHPVTKKTDSGEMQHCATCSKVYKSVNGLRQHMKRNHDPKPSERPLACSYCSQKFWGSAERERHVRIHTREKPYECNACGAAFSSGVTLLQHLKQVHASPKNATKCDRPGCGKILKNSATLKRHQDLSHSTSGPQPCPRIGCRKVFKNKIYLAQHVRLRHDNEKAHNCTYCAKKFATESQLGAHSVTHTGEKPFPCSACPRRFGTVSNRRQHELGVHLEEGRQGCPQCGRSFSNRGDLRRHLETHKGPEERQKFPCKICNKEFSCHDASQRHVLSIHVASDEYQHRCQYCPKRFATGDGLKRHLMVHTGEKPFKCSICSRTSGSSTNLRSHEKCFHEGGEKQNGCGECGKRFHKLQDLKDHLETHKPLEERRKFECTKCDKVLTSRQGLRYHDSSHV